jgi:hypothetical protein
MFDDLSKNEKVNMSRIELIGALESNRKIFSSYYKLESTFEDLSIDFHNLNDKTYDFIRVAIRHIVELEKIVEKYENPKFNYLATHN